MVYISKGLLKTGQYQNTILFGLIIILAFILRVWGIENSGLWHDEAVAHFYAMHDLSWIIKNCAGFIRHPPLFFILLHFWLKLVPPYSQFMVEMFNVIVSILQLIIFWVWLRKLFTIRTANLGLLLLSVNPFHIYFSSELRMYALAILEVTIAGYAVTQIMKNSYSLKYWGLLIIAATAGLYTHFLTGPVFVICFLFALTACHSNKCLSKWVGSAIIVTLLFSPWLKIFLAQVHTVKSGYWLPPFQWKSIVFLMLFFAGNIGHKSLIIGSAYFVCILIPWLYTLRNPDRNLLFAITSVVFTIMLVVVISLFGQSLFLYRIFFPVLPFWLIWWLYGASKLKPYILISVLILYFSLLAYEIVSLKNSEPNSYTKKISEWMIPYIPSNAVIIHTDNFIYYPAIFYHKNHYKELLLGRNGLNMNSIEKLLTRHSVVVITPTKGSLSFLNELRHKNPILEKLFVCKTREYRLFLFN